MHGGHGKVRLPHLVGQPVDLSTSVAENDRLSNSEGIIEITQCIKLSLFFFDSNEVLLETFQGQLVTLDQDTNRVCHELRRHVKHIVG